MKGKVSLAGIDKNNKIVIKPRGAMKSNDLIGSLKSFKKTYRIAKINAIIDTDHSDVCTLSISASLIV